MKNVCLIPARGGSKRIPKKNIKLFHGKPLIVWSIEKAIDSGLFEKIYVSSDDKKICDISRKNGAIVPFIRPKSLSDDYANDHQVRQHFINWMESENLKADYLCYLYPTCPLITKSTLHSCFELLINSQATCSHTVSTFDYPIQRALKIDKNGFLKFNLSKYEKTRSQDLEEFVHDAGQCYFFDLNKYSENPIRIGYKIPRYQCQDIDTEEDFIIAEKLFAISSGLV